MKKCRICGVEKEIGEFHEHKQMKDGHLNMCKECRKLERRKWYLKNRDFILKDTKRYYKENEETIKKKMKKYYEENKEMFAEKGRKNYYENQEEKKEYSRKYYKEHKEQQQKRVKERRANGEFKEIDRNHRHKRRAACKETDITTEWLKELREDVINCPICGVEMIDINLPNHPQQAQLDHIKPLNVGGKHMMNNVRFICSKCNNARPLDGSDFIP